MEFPFLNSLMLIVDKCTYIQFCMPGKILTFFGQSGFSGTVDNSATPVDSQPPRCSMGANASHRQNSYRNQKLDEDVWLLSPDSKWFHFLIKRAITKHLIISKTSPKIPVYRSLYWSFKGPCLSSLWTEDQRTVGRLCIRYFRGKTFLAKFYLLFSVPSLPPPRAKRQ